MKRSLLLCALATLVLAPAPADDPVPSSHPGMGAVPYAGGVTFRVWAPFADSVAVAGSFNNWSATAHPLVSEGGGLWSRDVPTAAPGDQYRFVIRKGIDLFWRNDPRARKVTNSTGNSVVVDSSFEWDVADQTTVLFSDDFEAPQLHFAWTLAGTGSWHVGLSKAYAFSGKQGLVLHGTKKSSWETSRATLALDASPFAELTLTFRVRNIGDEPHAADGVFLSADGASWKRVAKFPKKGTGWKKLSLDLVLAAAKAGFVPGKGLRIRFQQYDNWTLPSDGIAIDDVVVSGRKAIVYSTPAWNEMVIYEMHAGTFHDAPGGGPGTFDTAVERLDDLVALGVNAVKVMPIAEFAGDFSWGYNPAHPFAVESAYGGPEAFRRFVKEAHRRGIAVILDVVYNHFGPSDLDLWRFDGWSKDGGGGIFFYNDWRAKTPWGHTRPDYGRGEVRAYLRDNALMWLEDYRVDGLRWDSTVNIRTLDNGGGGDIPDGWSLMAWINNEIDARQPWKISIAEDLQKNAWVTRPTSQQGAGFDAQWDAAFVHPVRKAITAVNDADRDMNAVRDAILFRYNDDAFRRVIYTESHDEVANGKSRVPEEIWPGNAGSWASRKRSTLGAAIVLTAPGIPMIFQGQELLEDGYFRDDDPVDWSRAKSFAGIRLLYRDLIRLRRNTEGKTRGLSGPHVNVFHVNHQDKVIAYHRWREGGPRDDVVVAANFGAKAYPSYTIGFPKGGVWRVRFNSDWSGYGADLGNHPSLDTWAGPVGKDGLGYSASVGVGPYSVVILSQE